MNVFPQNGPKDTLNAVLTTAPKNFDKRPFFLLKVQNCWKNEASSDIFLLKRFLSTHRIDFSLKLAEMFPIKSRKFFLQYPVDNKVFIPLTHFSSKLKLTQWTRRKMLRQPCPVSYQEDQNFWLQVSNL